MSDLIFFRLEKLCPPDGSKVRFAKIKTLMQQYNIFVLQKILTLMLKKQNLLRLRQLREDFKMLLRQFFYRYVTGIKKARLRLLGRFLL